MNNIWQRQFRQVIRMHQRGNLAGDLGQADVVQSLQEVISGFEQMMFQFTAIDNLARVALLIKTFDDVEVGFGQAHDLTDINLFSGLRQRDATVTTPGGIQ